LACKILVVDDERELQHLILQRFWSEIQQGQYEFAFAYDGEEAMAILKNDTAVAIVVTDLNMPRMDGLTFIKTALNRGLTCQFVILTAFSDPENRQQGLNLGVRNFLTKPIDFGLLKKTIETIV
jgi:YesN/AraC family two-component response regulator